MVCFEKWLPSLLTGFRVCIHPSLAQFLMGTVVHKDEMNFIGGVNLMRSVASSMFVSLQLSIVTRLVKLG